MFNQYLSRVIEENGFKYDPEKDIFSLKKFFKESVPVDTSTGCNTDEYVNITNDNKALTDGKVICFRVNKNSNFQRLFDKVLTYI